MDNVFYEGMQIMVLGMGTVFAFLIIMVIVMGIAAKIVAAINKAFPEKIEELPSIAQLQSTNNGELAVAIAMASLKKK